jgi:hypothetical protein
LDYGEKKIKAVLRPKAFSFFVLGVLVFGWEN